eukprot:2720356-Amphidinium_carterae.1
MSMAGLTNYGAFLVAKTWVPLRAALNSTRFSFRGKTSADKDSVILEAADMGDSTAVAAEEQRIQEACF